MYKRGDEKAIVGYTSGVFDLFHIGHLNLLKNAKGLCDNLIVGVTSDELVSYKNKRAVIGHQERMEIVRNIKYVDAVVPMGVRLKTSARCGKPRKMISLPSIYPILALPFIRIRIRCPHYLQSIL